VPKTDRVSSKVSLIGSMMMFGTFIVYMIYSFSRNDH
jgi:hypothetical protein